MAKVKPRESVRTPIETMLLAEMMQDDRDFILRGNMEAAVDDIIPANTVGLFDDSTSSDDDLEDLLGEDDEYDDLF